MSNYAAGTRVAVDRTKSEIENMLRRHGATGYAAAWDMDTNRSFLDFKMPTEDAVRIVRIEVPMPDPDDPNFTCTPTGKPRALESAHKAFDQAVKQRWRQTALIIKAKLEACDVGISTLEREFLPDIVMQDGRTVGQVLEGQLPKALSGGSQLALPSGP